MECQRLFIKIKSHRLPGVQINVVYQQIQLFSRSQQAGCQLHSGHFTRIALDARNSSRKSDYYERIRCGAGLFRRSDLDHKCSKLQSCMDIAES